MGRKLSETGTAIRNLFNITKLHSTCKICGKVTPGFHTGNLTRHIERKHRHLIGENESRLSGKPKVTVVHISKNEEGDFITEEIVGEDDDEKPAPAKRSKRIIKKEVIENHTTGDAKHTEFISIPPTPSSTLMEPENLLQHYLDLILVDGMQFDFLDGRIGRIFFGQLNITCGLNVDTNALTDYIALRAKQMQREFAKDMANRPISLLIDIDSETDTCGVLAQFMNKKIEQRFLGYLDLTKHANGDDLLKDIQQLCSSYEIPEKMIYAIMVANETTAIELPIPSSIFRLTCLAELFESSILSTLSNWKPLLDKVLKGSKLSEGTRSLENILQQITAVCERKLKATGKPLSLNSDDWKTLASIADWLSTAKSTYDNLKDSQTHPVITDVVATVFKFWIQLGKQHDSVPQAFAKSLKTKFCNQLSNWGPINAAIFLDPRIQQILSTADKSAARTHITEVHVRWTCGNLGSSVKETSETVPSSIEDGEDEDDEDDLTAFLKEQSKSGQAAAQTSKIERLLQDFTDVPLVSAKTSVLSYWEKSERDSILRNLSQAILSIPAVARSWVDREHIRRLKSNKSFTPDVYMNDILFLGGNHFIVN